LGGTKAGASGRGQAGGTAQASGLFSLPLFLLSFISSSLLFFLHFLFLFFSFFPLSYFLPTNNHTQLIK
jgi:hypothetical protein